MQMPAAHSGQVHSQMRCSHQAGKALHLEEHHSKTLLGHQPAQADRCQHPYSLLLPQHPVTPAVVHCVSSFPHASQTGACSISQPSSSSRRSPWQPAVKGPCILLIQPAQQTAWLLQLPRERRWQLATAPTRWASASTMSLTGSMEPTVKPLRRLQACP